MFRAFFKFSKPEIVPKYTLDSSLSSSLDRLWLYSYRKFPSVLGIFPKNVGEWPYPFFEDKPWPRLAQVADDRTRLTYFGHRTVFIQMEGVRFITDPVLAKRLISGGLGVKRISRRGFLYALFPPADFLLISNNAFECLDTWTLRKITDQGGAMVVGGRNIELYVGRNYAFCTYPLSWFEEINFGSVKITFLPAMSETKRLYLCCGIDRNRLLWGGFLIRNEKTSIFYAGKTSFSKHFEEIRDYLKGIDCKLDIAILPIGPIFKQKRNMTPEEAVAAHQILKPKKTMVVAHDTFPLGIEAYGELKTRLIKEINRVDPALMDEFIILEETESYDLPV